MKLLVPKREWPGAFTHTAVTILLVSVVTCLAIIFPDSGGGGGYPDYSRPNQNSDCSSDGISYSAYNIVVLKVFALVGSTASVALVFILPGGGGGTSLMGYMPHSIKILLRFFFVEGFLRLSTEIYRGIIEIPSFLYKKTCLCKYDGDRMIFNIMTNRTTSLSSVAETHIQVFSRSVLL